MSRRIELDVDRVVGVALRTGRLNGRWYRRRRCGDGRRGRGLLTACRGRLDSRDEHHEHGGGGASSAADWTCHRTPGACYNKFGIRNRTAEWPNRCGAGVILPVVRCSAARLLPQSLWRRGHSSRRPIYPGGLTRDCTPPMDWARSCTSTMWRTVRPVWFRSTIEAQSAVSSRPVRRTGHGISRIRSSDGSSPRNS